MSNMTAETIRSMLKALGMLYIVWRAVMLFVLSGLAACGGGSGNTFGTNPSSQLEGGTTGTGTVSSSSAGTVVLSLSSSNISASTPGTVTAQVKTASGSPIANTIVTFSVTNGSATITPSRVLTDASGNASAAVVPNAGTLGADFVTASADIPGGTPLTTRTAFTVSSVTVTLTSVIASPLNVEAYGSTVINAVVAGASVSSPVTLSFSSSCAVANKATLSPSQLTVTGTTASITYQDKGCSGPDRVSAVIQGTAQQQQVDLSVAAPTAQSLEFVSASPEKICLKGSGCAASSVVTFRLKDQFGNGVQGRDVSFALDVPNVADLSFLTAKSDASGLVSVSVSARITPSPVRVRATIPATAGSAVLATVSNVLAINAGLPTNRTFSFSATRYNVDGNLDGDDSSIRVQLNDRFGNPVADGTSVSFVTEGASVIPARCVTTDGVCAVKFVVSNFRPDDGRVSVVAFAQGEESFDDANGDNVYTSGENWEDLGEVFIDKNEDRLMQRAAGEYVIGDAKNNVWDGNTFVRAGQVFTLSQTSVAPRLFATDGSGKCTSTRLPRLKLQPSVGISSCRVKVEFCLFDGNDKADVLGGNPVPSGATLAISTGASGASVSVSNTPVPGNNPTPTLHVITASLSDCTKPLTSPGALDFVVQMPGAVGSKYQFDLGTVE
jgi:hypothetical protein